MPVIKLTQQLLAAGIKCPEDKSRIEYCDTELPGFYVEARSQGHPTYYLRYKSHTGKTCHQKLGRTCDIDLVEARKKAKILKAEISLGADPRAEAKAQKEVPTLKDFFENHYLPFAKPRKRSWKRDVQLFARLEEAFGSQRLNRIGRQAIQTFHTGLVDSGLAHASADHHIKLLRRCMNLARDWGLMTEPNPAARIQLFNRDNKVEHYLDQEQLEKLIAVLKTDSNKAVCQIALFLLSTGCRLNEALTATWDQVDQKNRILRIAALNSKSKRIRSVPLNDAALAVLSGLTTEGRFDHLFINEETKKPYTTIMKVWTRLRMKAGLPHLRIHDLRHQFASFLVNSGRTLYEVQSILGHSDAKVTQRYSHLSTKTLHEAANSASVIINGATKAA
jgi:site-specific recombinase XerD